MKTERYIQAILLGMIFATLAWIVSVPCECNDWKNIPLTIIFIGAISTIVSLLSEVLGSK